MEQRLIDANAYAAEMKTRQDACKEIMDAAKEDDNWELYAHMSAEFSIFVEAKLTLDAMPTVDAVQVVRCEKCRHWIRNEDYSYVGRCELWDVDFENDFYCADGEMITE